MVFPEPGGPAKTMDSRARDAGSKELRGTAVQHLPLDQLVERAERQAGELPDVDEHVALPGHVTVDDVQPGTALELGVLKPLGGIELAVGARRSVEDPGQASGQRARRRGRPRRGSRDCPR